MIDLIFPDGSARQYPDGSTGRDVAASISKSLEKKALLIKLDGQLLDLDRPLTPTCWAAATSSRSSRASRPRRSR
jgi:threonyl-tRNA synthetase